MRRLFAHANYDFIGKRKFAYLISSIALIIGIGAAVLFAARDGSSWLNYGVDFTGGTLVTVRVPDKTEADLRPVVERSVAGGTLSRFGDEHEFRIRTPTAAAGATENSDAVISALREQFPNLEVVSTDAVGAKVGGEMQTRALIAILISFAGTLIYLAFRFEWRFGAAAILATAHDILITLGLLAVMRIEVSLPTVAAVLTIVGYSLNDKIVVFDRIRENLRGARRQEFLAILNRSINATLPRTVLTSVTTVATLLALFLFGGAVIRDFAFILIIGVVLGTYSSSFVAAPALLEIEQRFPHEQKQPRRARTPASVARPSRGGTRV